jgi:hypothetical protein
MQVYLYAAPGTHLERRHERVDEELATLVKFYVKPGVMQVYLYAAPGTHLERRHERVDKELPTLVLQFAPCLQLAHLPARPRDKTGYGEKMQKKQNGAGGGQGAAEQKRSGKGHGQQKQKKR